MLLYKLSKESKKKNICPKKVRKVELDFSQNLLQQIPLSLCHQKTKSKFKIKICQSRVIKIVQNFKVQRAGIYQSR